MDRIEHEPATAMEFAERRFSRCWIAYVSVGVALLAGCDLLTRLPVDESDTDVPDGYAIDKPCDTMMKGTRPIEMEPLRREGLRTYAYRFFRSEKPAATIELRDDSEETDYRIDVVDEKMRRVAFEDFQLSDADGDATTSKSWRLGTRTLRVTEIAGGESVEVNIDRKLVEKAERDVTSTSVPRPSLFESSPLVVDGKEFRLWMWRNLKGTLLSAVLATPTEQYGDAGANSTRTYDGTEYYVKPLYNRSDDGPLEDSESTFGSRADALMEELGLDGSALDHTDRTNLGVAVWTSGRWRTRLQRAASRCIGDGSTDARRLQPCDNSEVRAVVGCLDRTREAKPPFGSGGQLAYAAAIANVECGYDVVHLRASCSCSNAFESDYDPGCRGTCHRRAPHDHLTPSEQTIEANCNVADVELLRKVDCRPGTDGDGPASCREERATYSRSSCSCTYTECRKDTDCKRYFQQRDGMCDTTDNKNCKPVSGGPPNKNECECIDDKDYACLVLKWPEAPPYCEKVDDNNNDTCCGCGSLENLNDRRTEPCKIFDDDDIQKCSQPVQEEFPDECQP